MSSKTITGSRGELTINNPLDDSIRRILRKAAPSSAFVFNQILKEIEEEAASKVQNLAKPQLIGLTTEAAVQDHGHLQEGPVSEGPSPEWEELIRQEGQAVAQ